jgi:DNA primase
MYLDSFINRAKKSIFSHEEALEYLHGRGFSDGDILKYSIGYLKFATIKDDGSLDYNELKEKTWDLKGLQNRIIFPLKNILGHVNGIVIRDIYKKMYVQVLFEEAKKIGAFFGIYEALPHILSTKKVFVHEGAADCMSFAKVFPNSVSTLTSFINEPQYQMLRLFADKIILVFDNDGPGKFGVKKSIETYGDRYIHAIDIGYGDSNKCLQQLGDVKFDKYIKSRVPLFLR